MKLRGITDYSKYYNDAKTALKKKKKSTDHRGLNTKHNYSSFWMDDKWDSTDKFSGLNGNLSAASDTVKLIKLVNYRRAITNFVKIVSKQDIPVLWAGSDSYTNGKSITLSSDIKDNNFDVTVGLALHEASHVILTEFEVLSEMNSGKNAQLQSLKSLYRNYQWILDDLLKDLLNWVEDRRIDHYIFSTSPGYKAYYHKLYDTYWNSKDVTKGFLSSHFRDPSKLDNYLFHIINMMNPSFEPKAMPGLSKIVSIVDLKNISRLKNTRDALQVAYEVCLVIMDEYTKSKESQSNNVINKDDEENEDGEDQTQTENGTKTQGGSKKTTSEDNGDGGDDNEDDNKDDVPDMVEITPSEVTKIATALRDQRRFLSGDVKKKSSTKKMQQELDNIAQQAIDIQTVGDSSIGTRTVLMYDYISGNRLQECNALSKQITELYDKKSRLLSNSDEHKQIKKELETLESKRIDIKYFRCSRDEYKQAVREGIDMGGLLGKKLQLHNESRERVDTRLRSGKIDAKRLAHAGYGIEGIFKQIHIDKYKKANLHISLDGSGSMSGIKWADTVKMTMAIAKAATYTQNINIQVSIRVTETVSRGDTPANLFVYDSRKNKIGQLISAFEMFNPTSMTPEGLCFEAMIKKNLLVETSSEVDSYFLNISDGEPGCSSYGGYSAIQHTKRQVDHMKNVLNMSVVSFFVQVYKDDLSEDLAYAKLVEQFNASYSGRNFRTMYGKDATVVRAGSAIQIAKELNKKFLSKKA